ncbi:SseB family protein [Aliiroseovarius sp. S1339]|uniref:SseB family protein n=1 Tax=Aliiroseovarius sp. S1339 TaxID=2936990 RepID=UPI0020C17F6D|nr:SseB family protein [Aliiroseovarius sp. S1339]MCK8465212.1 SseB family protein [Aliiroseovarius sp. S1339]
MTETTRLDDAHTAMQADLNDDAARLRFYERLADGELFLLLTEEPVGNDITPDIFELEGASFVLVFDREDRLAEFVGAPAPYAALPGRVIASMLAGQNIGLGVNLGVAPSSILIPSDALDWLADTLKSGPQQVEARIAEVHSPSAPETLIAALDAKLASAGGLASHACLAGVTYADGRKGHLLGFIDAVAGAENALAGAANEALTFSGLDAGEIDVGFFAGSDQVGGKLAALGVRFDLPAPQTPQRLAPVAPGSDPEKPPILK